MTRPAQNAEVRYVVSPTLGQGDEVVAVPLGRQETVTAHFAASASSLETMLSILRVLRVFVVPTVRVTFQTERVVELRVMLRAVVPLARSSTYQARTRTSPANLMRRTSRSSVRGTPATDYAGLRTNHETPSQSAQVVAVDPTRGKNGRPHVAQTLSRRFSWRSFVSFRSLAVSSIWTSRSVISWSR